MKFIHDIVEINDVVRTSELVLFYVSSENCDVCKVISPRLTAMLSKYPEWKAVKANINDLPILGSTYSVFTIPCILLFAEGKEIFREARFINLEAIEEIIVRYRGILF